MRSARRPATAALPIEEEIARERAAALARIAGVLEGLLDELARLGEAAASAGPEQRRVIARQHEGTRALALRYRWYLLVQREANGLRDDGALERLYPVAPPLAGTDS